MREEWRNNSRKNVDMTGDESKVQCCREQYCIGTWNVKSVNQGKLDVVKQEMARVNINILGISELIWIGIVKVKSFSRVWLFVTPWVFVAHQTPLVVGFFKQECWSGLPFPSWGDLPDQSIKLGSSSWQVDSLPTELPGKPPNGLVPGSRPGWFQGFPQDDGVGD